MRLSGVKSAASMAGIMAWVLVAACSGRIGDGGAAGDGGMDARLGDGVAADATHTPQDGGQDGSVEGDGSPPGCGDSVCDGGETCETCPSDCGECPEECDPPNTVWIGDRCVPSCGFAGGNTCVDVSSTLCDCLPALESYDCQVCCNRPAYPQPVPNSHHIVVIADFTSWDSIYDLSSTGQGPMITSQNKPSFVPWDQWARNIHYSWYATGHDMADAIHGALCDPAGAPMKVMIDELKPATVGQITDCADRMRTVYPQWQGRWGAYLVNGENVAYPNLNPAIDALLEANAIIAAEMYVSRSRYCSSGSTAGARDIWLSDFFRGTPTQGRFHWLAERRGVLGSSSQLTVLFGVTDTYMDGASPAVFLDRMFYVWVTRTGYRSILLSANGGAGAYKWQYPDVSNTSRDLAFKESFEHYCINGSTTSRLGQVSCP